MPRDSTGVHALVTGSSDGLVRVYDLRHFAPLLDIERLDPDSADFTGLRVTMNGLPGQRCLDAATKRRLATLHAEDEAEIRLGWLFLPSDLWVRAIRAIRKVWREDLDDCA